MQDLTPRFDNNAQLIQSYGPEGFRIAQQHYPSHVAVFANRTAMWDGELSEASVLKALNVNASLNGGRNVEVLLIGTGTTHRPLDAKIRQALKTQGVALDVMATGAAARTFNILLGEARQAAALLLLPA